MNIMFDIGLPPHIRHYDNVVDVLRRRGHKVSVTTCLDSSDLYQKITIDLDHRSVVSNVVFIARESWGEFAYYLRALRDFIHYTRPEYAKSDVLWLRTRNMLRYGMSQAITDAGRTFESLLDHRSLDERLRISEVVGAVHSALPTSPRLEAAIRKRRPDLLLITPLIFTQYGQFDLLRAARRLGIPVGFMVFSWDNLSTKGILQEHPDAIFLWNRVQTREIVRYYDFPHDKIYECGAPRFDYFFEKRPSRSREEFCSRYDFDPSLPIVTYLCSSNLVSSSESVFVSRWLDALDSASDPLVRDCNVIIRPHPKFRAQWDDVALGTRPRRIAVSGSAKLNNDQLLFDTLSFSSVAVGLNTSAQLEAAVLGKPVITINVPEYSEGLEGTIHFHYLLKENGGFVERSNGLGHHVQQLGDILNGRYERDAIRKFVEMFIRPKGIDTPAAEVTADAIEDFGRQSGRPVIGSVSLLGRTRLKSRLRFQRARD